MYNCNFNIEKFYNDHLLEISEDLIFSNRKYIQKFIYFRQIYNNKITIKNFENFFQKNEIRFLNLEDLLSINNKNLNELINHVLQKSKKITSIKKMKGGIGYYVLDNSEYFVLLGNFRILHCNNNYKIEKITGKKEFFELVDFLCFLDNENFKLFFDEIDLKFKLIFNKNLCHSIIVSKRNSKELLYLKFISDIETKNLKRKQTKDNIFIYVTENLKSLRNLPNIFKVDIYRYEENDKNNSIKETFYIDIYNVDYKIENLNYFDLFLKFENENLINKTRNFFSFLDIKNVKTIEYDIEDGEYWTTRFLIKNNKDEIVAIKNNENSLDINYLKESLYSDVLKLKNLYNLFEDRNISKICGPGKIHFLFNILDDKRKIFEPFRLSFYFYLDGKNLNMENYLKEISSKIKNKEFLEFCLKYF